MCALDHVISEENGKKKRKTEVEQRKKEVEKRRAQPSATNVLRGFGIRVTGALS